MGSQFENIKTRDASLPEQVAEQISQLIIERQLSAEDKLPNEFELATQLNVGRGTIREAVKLLVARNVLVIRRGKGTFIARHPGEIEDPLGFAYYPDQDQLALDLYEVRLQLEPWVASLAARRATEEDLRLVRETCLQVEQDILSGADHLPRDMQFHTSIAQCTQSLVVPKLIPIITYSVGLFGSLNAHRSETIVCHRAIMDAICARDPEAAERAMRRHLEETLAELEQIRRGRKLSSRSNQNDKECEFHESSIYYTGDHPLPPGRDPGPGQPAGPL